jgi:quinol monooxygenase YgiN
MKTVIVEYTLNPAASQEEIEAKIAEFVAGIRDLGLGIQYTSYRKSDRSYVHVGAFPSDAALKQLQEAPFFLRFGAFLREQCNPRPAATWVEPVASTAGAGA